MAIDKTLQSNAHVVTEYDFLKLNGMAPKLAVLHGRELVIVNFKTDSTFEKLSQFLNSIKFRILTFFKQYNEEKDTVKAVKKQVRQEFQPKYEKIARKGNEALKEELTNIENRTKEANTKHEEAENNLKSCKESHGKALLQIKEAQDLQNEISASNAKIVNLKQEIESLGKELEALKNGTEGRKLLEIRISIAMAEKELAQVQNSLQKESQAEFKTKFEKIRSIFNELQKNPMSCLYYIEQANKVFGQ